MKYVLLLTLPDATPDDGDAASEVDEVAARAEMAAYAELKAQLQEEGVWLGGQALQPPGYTTQVRVREQETLVVDGPLAETAEQVAGYYLVECVDLDEAVSVAARIPGARHGTVEVRPVWDYERLLV